MEPNYPKEHYVKVFFENESLWQRNLWGELRWGRPFRVIPDLSAFIMPFSHEVAPKKVSDEILLLVTHLRTEEVAPLEFADTLLYHKA